jgi:hypothetical protein
MFSLDLSLPMKLCNWAESWEAHVHWCFAFLVQMKNDKHHVNELTCSRIKGHMEKNQGAHNISLLTIWLMNDATLHQTDSS